MQEAVDKCVELKEKIDAMTREQLIGLIEILIGWMYADDMLDIVEGAIKLNEGVAEYFSGNR